MADEQPPPKRPTWLTLSVAGAAVSVIIYVFVIGSEIGTMRQQTTGHELRITALETHGSGPVQSAAAKVDAVTARADRILTELLAMQKQIAELQSGQQSNALVLQRLQEDVAKERRP
jgi:peptidoglycan hydrolase CwlO-like protein